MLNLRWSWHAETRELFAVDRPGGLGAAGRDPVTLLSRGAARAAGRAGRRPRLPAPPRRRRRRSARVPVRAALVPGQPARAAGGRPAAIAYFSPEYGITAALPQYSGGLGILAGDHLKASQRPRRAADRRRPAVPARLLHPVAVASTAGRPSAIRPVTPTACRSPCSGTADGSPGAGSASALADGALLAAQVWLAQVGRVPLLLLDSYVEENEPGPARGHRPAVRRRQRSPAAPGTAARHRRGARGAGVLRDHRAPAARGVPHQRGPRRASSAWSGSAS